MEIKGLFFSQKRRLEFKYLAGIKDYYERAQMVTDVFYRANNTYGLFHDQWSRTDGNPSGQHFTISATADSGYDPAKRGDPKARKQSNGIINNLVYQTPTRGLLYASDIQ
ncbi:hypothetical protein BYT27DRAFT_6849121 [Phlegmacium glaucopus]|nr:hypothetical protein BYT27DRAFT_6849121 [Phlegmacium glaucopus]